MCYTNKGTVLKFITKETAREERGGVLKAKA